MSVSVLGMVFGFVLVGLFEFKYIVFGVIFNVNMLLGWIMVVVWFFYFIWVVIGFKEFFYEYLIVDEVSLLVF